ncbi:MAG TPA: type II secretion system protein GspE [Ruminococcaceae bacterium]|jgi:type IV pilus assembly protein PilB|nr:type II secretion system protein GspE [Oscillospiraceae bacterium]
MKLSLNRLEDMLLAQGCITKEQHNTVRQYIVSKRVSSTVAITDLKFMSLNEIYCAIAKTLKVEFVPINDRYGNLNDKVIALVSEDICKAFCVLPWEVKGNELKLLIENPQDMAAIKEVQDWSGKKVIPVMAVGKQLKNIIDHYFKNKNAKERLQTLVKQGLESVNPINTADTTADGTGPIVEFLNMLLEQAAIDRASDIHIKPNEKDVRIRMRVDGELREITRVSIGSLNTIISRIKVLSNLNIAEKRVPQDGAFTYKGKNCLLEIRVSILPSLFGESCVMRVIDKRGIDYDYVKLGMSEEDEIVFRKMIGRPDGLILVTGPTGSGKSTTLYTALKELNRPAVNIITVEDPVESPVKDINQIQVNSQVGLDFSAALRSILRHDPDIIFIGEIRDGETARIAVRSSITGHLVLSTLHTNDAISAVMRLCDMGIEKYLVTSALSGVVAQRLLKRVCPECSEDHRITSEEAVITGLAEGIVTKIGKGCMSCGNTGYSGRIAIYEFVLITKELRNAILNGATMDELFEVAKRNGMISLKDSCKDLLLNGITSCREAIRIIYAKE